MGNEISERRYVWITVKVANAVFYQVTKTVSQKL